MRSDAPLRTLETAALSQRGIQVALQQAGLFTDLLKLLWGSEAPFPGARAELMHHRGQDRVHYDLSAGPPHPRT